MNGPEHAAGAESVPCPHCGLDVFYWSRPGRGLTAGVVTIESLSHRLPACQPFADGSEDPRTFVERARQTAAAAAPAASTSA